MPGFIGDRLVEELSEGKETLIHVPSNFDLYRKKAEIVRNVLREYDPEMKSYSLDEAYLDIGPYLALYLQSGSQWSHEQIKNELMKQKDFTPTDHDDVVTDGIFDDERKADTSQENEDNGDNLQNKVKECKVSASAVHILQAYSSIICIQALERIVQGLRQRVQQATGGLTCSVGVGPNFSIAKIASDRNKPNGQLCVDPSQVLDFIRPLPVRKVPGVGRVTEKILQQVCDIETVQDLYNQRHLVYWLFGCGATAHFLLRASVGCSTSMTSLLDIGVGSTEEQQPGGVSSRSSSSSSTDHQKGISRERTFSPDDSWVNLNMKLEEIARMVYDDLKRKSIVTRTITVKVKLKSFDVLSRAHSLPTGTYIEDAKQLVHVAAQIFAQIRSSYFDKIEDGQSPMKKRRDFVVRLLGIRCSNLIEESEFQTIQAGRLDTFLTTSSNRSSQTSKGGVVSHKYKSPLRTSHNQGAISESTNYETKSTKLETPICDLGRNVGGDETGVNDTTKIAEEGRQKVFCPLCNRGFPFQDNDSLNTHLDTCLSSGVVREVIKEEDSRLTSSESSRKRQRLTDFFEHA
jgi:DNA polymerase kappa